MMREEAAAKVRRVLADAAPSPCPPYRLDYQSALFHSANHRVYSHYDDPARIMAGIDDVNRHPVIHTWSYKLAEAA